MYRAQALERQLVMLLVNVFGTVQTQQEYDKALEANFEKTMGKLVNELLRHGASDTLVLHLSAEVRLALEIRYSLAHNYFWRRAVYLVSFEGRKVILDELSRYFGLFTHLDDIFTALTEMWASERGITQADFQQAMNELLTRSQHLLPEK